MSLDHFIYKSLFKITTKIFHPEVEILPRETNPDVIAKMISDLITSDRPVMICRYGSTELMCMVNYLGVMRGKPNLIRYFLGKELDWWWKSSSLKQIEQWSGFFPPTISNVEIFCELMIKESEQVDILASWLEDERYFKDKIINSTKIQGLFLDPFWSENPWTKSLEGKKVLIIHPFENDIKNQYINREKLFANQNILPEFELVTIKAVQSLGGKCEYESWFEALDFLKKEIDKVNFDICLLGCGSYGFPLAAYIKSKGKKAIHMGGSLQLLFGIKGKRWENPNYGSQELGKTGLYLDLMNEYWIYPGEETKPANANKVEGACYW